MDPRIVAAVQQGAGLATARRLHALGIDPRVVARLVRSGDLVPVRRGVYTTREVWDTWDEWRARPLARVRAVDLTSTTSHVYSHDSAALLLELPLIRPHASDVHVTREGVVGSPSRHGLRHHGAPYAPEDIEAVDGFAVLAAPRTVADLARTHGYEAGLVAADGALRLGHSRASLRQATDTMTSWPGITTARAVVEAADPGAESAAETLARILVTELGVGDVETQFPVRTASGVRWCDLRVGCHVFEVHGRIKITPREDGGVASEPPGQVLWRERTRERDVTSRGLGMSLIYWQDFWGDGRVRARQRLGTEYAATCRRLGTELPADLAEDARRLRARGRRATG